MPRRRERLIESAASRCAPSTPGMTAQAADDMNSAVLELVILA